MNMQHENSNVITCNWLYITLERFNKIETKLGLQLIDYQYSISGNFWELDPYCNKMYIKAKKQIKQNKTKKIVLIVISFKAFEFW